MAEQKTEIQNRSVVRYSNEQSKRITRECIETALIQLMAKEDFAKISVSDIVKRAGVSRTAFYRNYTSKEEVLQSSVEETVAGIAAAPYSDDPDDLARTLLPATEEYMDDFRLLLKAGLGGMVLDRITAHLIGEDADLPETERRRKIMWAGAAYNLLVDRAANHRQ